MAPDSSFLDDDNSKHESFSNKKFHKIDLDKDETVNDGKGSKYRTTTEEPDSTESPVTTTKAASTTQASPITTEGQSADKPSTSTPKIKTTTSNAPLDNHTTTERIKMTTEKSAHVLPAYQSHSLRWILGELFSSFSLFFHLLSRKNN